MFLLLGSELIEAAVHFLGLVVDGSSHGSLMVAEEFDPQTVWLHELGYFFFIFSRAGG